MSRLRAVALVVAGLAFVALGGVLGLLGSETGPRSPGVTAIAVLIALVALVAALRKVWGTPDADDGPAVPWGPDASFASPAPERTDREPPLSSDALAGVIEAAGARARAAGSVDDGIAVVRPPLREALCAALERGDRTPVEVERALARGAWTDDPVAASVLEADLPEPDRPLAERVRDWLFPERAVRERARRATNAVAEAADAAVPSVPGQTAPRSLPVLEPRLEELTRGADGQLHRAIDPDASARGPRPPRATLGDDAADPSGDAADSAGNSPTDPGVAGESVGAAGDAGPGRDDEPTATVEVGRLPRFRGAVAAALVLVVAGLLEGGGVLVLGALVPLAFVAYGALSTTSVPDDLRVRRTISPTPVPPGRPVSVTLTVTNESARTLPDVRVVDGVPRRLAVLEGSPRAGATLAPGDRLSVEYLVVARRGTYDFEPPRVRVRGPGGTAVATTTPVPAGGRTLRCRLDADAPPLEERGLDRVGRLTADRAGEGVAFHSTREYRPDDPADRIDWRHYAKRGSLATVSYERQVAATVVLVVDAREPNRVVAAPGRPTAVELAAYAATRTLVDLLGHGHDVGLAILGVDGDGPAGLEWLAPAGGREHRSRALEVLREATASRAPATDDGTEATDSATRGGAGTNSASGVDASGSNAPRGTDVSTSNRSRTDPNGRADRSGGPDGRPRRDGRPGGTRTRVRRLLELAPAGAQLALFSPLLDDPPVEAVGTWRAGGRPVAVLSPDVVPANTVSGQHARTERRTRLARCQAAGARTVDWRRGTPLPLAIEYAFRVEARLPSGQPAAGVTGGDA